MLLKECFYKKPSDYFFSDGFEESMKKYNNTIDRVFETKKVCRVEAGVYIGVFGGHLMKIMRFDRDFWYAESLSDDNFTITHYYETKKLLIKALTYWDGKSTDI